MEKGNVWINLYAKGGSQARFSRDGYQSNGRSNNLFGKDRSTEKTLT